MQLDGYIVQHPMNEVELMVVANDEDSVRVELGNRKEVKKLKTMNVTRDFKPKL